MKLSLNPARMGADNLSLTQFIDLAARHGFNGVDFGINAAIQAAQSLGGPAVLGDYCAEKGVAPAVFGLDVEWRRDNDTYEQGVGKLAEKAGFARDIGCTRCVTWMPPSVNDNPADWERHTARRFGEIGRILGEYGIRFGLEWVGPHHLRAGGANAMGVNPWIHTMEGTLDLIDRIGLPNVGLLVDSYHCYTTGVTGATLATLADSLIVHVHINDAPAGAGIAGAKDGERVLPGEGEIDLSDFLGGLQAAGYSGYISTEVLAPQNLASDPETAAANIRASLRRVGLT